MGVLRALPLLHQLYLVVQRTYAHHCFYLGCHQSRQFPRVGLQDRLLAFDHWVADESFGLAVE
jgi:hypothetical protein